MMTTEEFLHKFESKSHCTTKWYWQPYHKTGLQVIGWVNNKYPDLTSEQKSEIFYKHAENISVVRASEKIRKLAPQITDELGSLMPLDPSHRMKETLRVHKEADFFVLAISDLRSILKNRQPSLQATDEDIKIRKLWKHKPDILARYERLCPWDQLEILENLFGLTKSYTTLEFQLIDAPADIL